jgi:hypothetical protein
MADIPAFRRLVFPRRGVILGTEQSEGSYGRGRRILGDLEATLERASASAEGWCFHMGEPRCLDRRFSANGRPSVYI